jgi:hypothetical protein
MNHLAQDRKQIVGFCEHYNEHSRTINRELEWVSMYYHLREESATRNWSVG